MNSKRRDRKDKRKRQTAPKAQATVSPNLVCLADVQEQLTRWLWAPYIPLGKLTILEGDPDSGKSYMSLEIAAHVTTGRSLPFGRRTIDEGNDC
jgi:hypothetical protein